MRRESEFRLLAPLVALALGAMAVFVASLLIWARQVDADVRTREIALVERGVLTSIAEIERSILPETNWDEAVVNLDNRFDAAWMARRPEAALLWKSIAFPLDCGYNFASSIAAGAPLQWPWRGPHCFPTEPCP